MAGTVTVSLHEAGLAHAPGKSDRCEGGLHDVPAGAVKNWDVPGWVDAGDLAPVLQALHDQAHIPGGTRYWESCREPGCAEAGDLL